MIIVSGSHLIFLSLIIEKSVAALKWNWLSIAVLPLLSFYSLVTGCEAPVTRALFSIGIRQFQGKQKLFWSESEITFISLLMCFFLFSPWTESYSLLLSYVASVSLTLTSRSAHIAKHTMIYVILLPFLLPLAAPHPLSIFSNMTLAPFIGAVLFPASFVSFILPPLTSITDLLWGWMLGLCQFFGNELSNLPRSKFSIHSLWTLGILLNFYGIYSEKRKFK